MGGWDKRQDYVDRVPFVFEPVKTARKIAHPGLAEAGYFLQLAVLVPFVKGQFSHSEGENRPLSVRQRIAIIIIIINNLVNGLCFD
eukprot:scaffold5653_cov147-Cylindrotheca_fusiformis.AAC.2